MKHSQHDKKVHKQDTRAKAITEPDAPVKDKTEELMNALIAIRDDPNKCPIDIRIFARNVVDKAKG